MKWTNKNITTHQIKWFPKYGMFGLLGKNGYGGTELDHEKPYGKSGSSTSYSPYCLSEYYQKRMEIIGNVNI